MNRKNKLTIDVDDDFINMIVDLVIEKMKALNYESEKKEELEFFTVKQVVQISKKSNLTIRNHIHAGLLKAKKVGKSFLIKQEDLHSYLENR
jgi:excisionase family DNA binding protein